MIKRTGPTGWLLALSVSLLLVGSVLTGAVESGFTGQLTNPINSIGVGTLLLKGSPATSGCDTAALPAFTGTPTAPCPGATAVPAATPGTSSFTVTADGTLPTAAQLPSAAASLSSPSCGPVQLANSVAAADPMLVRGGVTYAVPGPLSNSTGLGLDGVGANHTLASDIVSGNTATLLGTSFSAAIWFKVSSGNTGALFGYGGSPNDGAEVGASGPVMWINSFGGIMAGVRTTLGSITTTSSGTTSYSDGAWHLAVMTIATTALTVTISVYVDSAAAGSNSGLLSLATGYIGYWHVGWSPVSLVPFASGTSDYLKGSLSDAVEFGTTLTAAQVASLATSGTQATWQSRITAAGARAAWQLGDDGNTSYTGTLPVIGTTSACSFVDAAIGGTGFCIYPNAIGTGCGAPASMLSGVPTGSPLALPPLVSGASRTITTTLARDSSYATTCSSYCPGLHLLLPVTVTESLAGLSSTLSIFAGQTVI